MFYSRRLVRDVPAVKVPSEVSPSQKTNIRLAMYMKKSIQLHKLQIQNCEITGCPLGKYTDS